MWKQNEIKTKSKRNQIEIKRENPPIKEEPPKKERAKENNTQEENITLVREKEKESKKELLRNNNNNVCTREGDCYEDIIRHYAGDLDVETKSAIWQYIQYFQAKTGCFILNGQLKQFLRNVRDSGLLFPGGIMACLTESGIDMAMMELS